MNATIPSRAIILVGAPASGKTTYALSARFSTFEYINPDLFPSEKSLRTHIQSLIYYECDFIIDSCNGEPSRRAFFFDIIMSCLANVRKAVYSIECHHLTTTIAQCTKLASNRRSSGGLRAAGIKTIKYCRTLIVPSMAEGFSAVVSIPFVEQTESQYVYRAVFFSLHGTISYSKSSGLYPQVPEDIGLFEGVNLVFRKYYNEGYRFFAISNEVALANKTLSEEVSQECLLRTVSMLNVPVDEIFYCPHVDDKSCSCRLPKSLWAHQTREKYKLNLKRSIMVGNCDTDQTFANNAGFGYYMQRETFFSNPKGRIGDEPHVEEAIDAFSGVGIS